MAKKRRVKRIRNCDSSRDQHKDWTYDTAVEARSLEKIALLPPSVDLREKWWRIGDQGSTGSCVGWACADGVLRWHMVKAGLIEKTQRLSVRFLWMASKETDTLVSYATTFIELAGSSIKSALGIARKYGVVEESVLPFGGKLSPLKENSFYGTAAQRKIGSYFSLTSGNKLDNFKNWLANNGPIAARLLCDRSWERITSHGKLEKYDTPNPNGGHAITIVGYTKNHFIIRNSFGTGWGNQGFAYASYDYTKAAFDEAYGVKV